MSKKKATNEQIVAALLAHGTKRAAADALGISEQSIYSRMEKADFRAMYAAARADVLREAVAKLGKSLVSAVETVTAIMTDKEVNAAIRLQAAQTVINNVGKLGAIVSAYDEKSQQEKNDAALALDGFFPLFP